MMRVLLIASVIATTTLTSAFADDSIGEPNTTWEKHTIKVCWGTAAHIRQTQLNSDFNSVEQMDIRLLEQLTKFNAKSKAMVKSIVTKEYTQERIGISFTGWKDCGTTTDADVVLFAIKMDPDNFIDDLLARDLPAGMASIGERSVLERSRWRSSKSQLKSYVFLKQMEQNPKLKVSTEDSLRLTALHEFGHLLGLRHEHARMEAGTDVNCFTAGVKLRENTDKSTRFYGTYDADSIMSYCHVFMLKYKTGLNFIVKETRLWSFLDFDSFFKGEYLFDVFVRFDDQTLVTKTPISNKPGLTFYQAKIGLSQGDVHTLRCMYGFYGQTDEAKMCQPKFNPLAD